MAKRKENPWPPHPSWPSNDEKRVKQMNPLFRRNIKTNGKKKKTQKATLPLEDAVVFYGPAKTTTKKTPLRREKRVPCRAAQGSSNDA